MFNNGESPPQANHEFDFFETRVRSLKDVVDVFLVQESNYTTFGGSKELEFLSRLRRGWLKEHQEKIGYVYLSHFTEKGKTNGWYADSYLRTHLSRGGLRLVDDARDDDLFLYLDADELPTREVLLFLKLYDGYTEPIKFGFRWTVFGFYWLKTEDPSILDRMFMRDKQERLLTLYVACTMGMLRKVYGNNAMLLRRNVWSDSLLADRDGTHQYFYNFSIFFLNRF
jgi:beta-1,4-mannosyl-glycoprotein beta-1,4-N-acetylglucosaminyltransferase